MKLYDIMTAPWAIVPEKLREIKGIYETHMRGEKIDVKGIEAKLGEPLAKKEQGYEIANRKAIIPIDGVIAKKMNLLSQISGGASTQLIERDFINAINDPAVDSIILLIDSPGGTVDGTQELANTIYAMRGKKPVIAFADGMMGSAAYWIGAAADKIIMKGETTQVGSIGVVATHIDISKAEEKAGIKTTEVVAGKYKRVASMYTPLSEEGLNSIQEKVDYIYSLFINDIAKFRGVSPEQVLTDMAEGRVFIGSSAIKAGLVDGVSTLDGLVSSSGTGFSSTGIRACVMTGKMLVPPQKKAEATKTGEEVKKMDIQKLKTEFPDVYNAVLGEGQTTGIEQGKAQGIKEGAEAERARIQGVFSHHRPGREKLIAEMLWDGKTTRAEAADRILAAEDELRSKVAANIKADAGAMPKVPAAEPPLIDAAADTAGKKEKLIREHMDANKCDYKTAVLAVSKANPELWK